MNKAIIVLLSLVLSSACLADNNDVNAVVAIKSMLCQNDVTAQNKLNQIGSHISQDKGWRIFRGADFYDIERSLYFTKTSEARYRWRIDAQGNVSAVTDRAKALQCIDKYGLAKKVSVIAPDTRNASN